ncbi:hypothetical protein PI125_g23130 [Phytophthora idaei]|nr:hypothetical protein PI125_g23130 [Phytophthora idaei]
MAKSNTIRKTNLTDTERQRVLMALLLRSTNGDLKRGDLSAIAAAEGVHPSTISRLWARAKVEAARSGHFASSSRRNRSGRRASDPTPPLERLRGVDVAQRSTIRSAVVACDMAPTTLFWQLHPGRLRTHTSVVKPVLTDANKAERLQFALLLSRCDTIEYVDINDTTIVVQQENAPAHIAADDAAFTEAVADAGRNIRLRNQPPNNPNLNCNDLGLFSAIQARQRKKTREQLTSSSQLSRRPTRNFQCGQSIQPF